MNEHTLPCPVVRDLLPLYFDGVVEQETAQSVERHLEHCRECAAQLESLGRPLPEPARGRPEEEASRADQVLTRLNRRAVRRGAAVALAAALLAAGILAFLCAPIWSLSADQVRVDQVFLTGNGENRRFTLVYTLDDSCGGSFGRFDQKDGVLYLTERVPLIRLLGFRPRSEKSFSTRTGGAREIHRVVFNGTVIWELESDGYTELPG